MAKVRSVDFLPEIFQTDVNKQFLAATLDQLIQEQQTVPGSHAGSVDTRAQV